MSALLLDTAPLLVLPELACAVGLNEAIVLQQIHYWVILNGKAKRNYQDGHYWTYNTYAAWKAQLPFWSDSTIKRTFSVLESKGLVISGNYNKTQMDRTKWYRIDYGRLKELSPLCQIDPMQGVDLTPPLPEITGEENSTEKIRGQESKVQSCDCTREGFSIPKNVFRRSMDEHGKEDTQWAFDIIGTYVDQLYPKATGRKHNSLNKGQRMGFAKKFLDFVNSYSLLGDAPYDILKSIVADKNIPAPTIFVATSPKVLGYHAVKTKAIDYYDLMDGEYCPCEDYF